MSGRAATTDIIPGKFALSVGRANMPTPPGWEWVQLTDIARLETGHTPSRKHEEYWDGDFAWIGIKDARLNHGGVIQDTLQTVTQLGLDNSAARLLPPGTVCLSRTASVGYALVMGREMATSQDFVNWVCSEAIVPKYLMYALLAEGEGLRDFGKGTTHTSIYFPEVKAFHVCIPPRKEQERIVDKVEELLSDVDAGVEALKRVQANQKRYRLSVLKAAVEGKLTEAWREQRTNLETSSALLSRVPAPSRPNRYKTRSKDVIPGHAALAVGNPKTRLPNGWSWVPLVDVARMESGHTPSRRHPEWWEGDIPWIGIADAREHDGGNIAATCQYTNDNGLANSAARLLPEGTVCISRTASVGYVTVMQRPMATSQDFVNWIPTEAVTSDWLKIVFMADREALRSFGKGSVHKTIYFPEWLSMHIAVPPLREQAAIAAEVESQLSLNDAAALVLKQGLKRAARLRQSILKDAFEGKLVAQDPADEPASDLLARIKAERDTAAPKPKKKTTRRSQRIPKKVTQRRGAIVAYTIAQSGDVSTKRKSESLGRTKLVKALYIAQTHEELDLQFRFQRYAAGPFDEAVYKLEGTGNKNDWFSTKERTGYGVTYHPADNTEAMCDEANEFLGTRRESIDRLLKHIAKMDMKQAELFATTYAAWNDLLIDERDATEASIIEEFYGWDESKQKFTKAEIKKQLKWMRSNDYVPTGKGERTEERAKETKLPSKKRRRNNG